MEGKFLNGYYAGYVKPARRTIKILIPLSSLEDKYKANPRGLDTIIAGIGFVIGNYYRAFNHYPSAGEVLGTGGNSMIYIQRKYFIKSIDPKKEDRLGFIIEINLDKKDLEVFY